MVYKRQAQPTSGTVKSPARTRVKAPAASTVSTVAKAPAAYRPRPIHFVAKHARKTAFRYFRKHLTKDLIGYRL